MDIVVSHHAAPLKAQLVGQILSALVLPAPESYRPLLRRLASLGEYCMFRRLKSEMTENYGFVYLTMADAACPAQCMAGVGYLGEP